MTNGAAMRSIPDSRSCKCAHLMYIFEVYKIEPSTVQCFKKSESICNKTYAILGAFTAKVCGRKFLTTVKEPFPKKETK